MIIILKKDGTVVTDDGNPVEGVKLENAAAILADPKDGDTIVYDATAGMWVAGTGGGSFEPDITNPQDGDTLVYDASEGKWVNGSGGGGGGTGGGVLAVHTEFGTLDKTWQEIYDALKNGYHVSIVDSTSPEDDPDDYMAGQTIILSAAHAEDDYSVYAYRGNYQPIFHAAAADGYPTKE